MSRSFIFSNNFILCICLVALGAGTSSAAEVYNNGPSNLSDGTNISAYVAADDFSLGESTNLQQMSIFSSADADPYPRFTNLINWAILSDNYPYSEPGPIFATGSSLISSFQDTGNQILGTEEFALTIPFVLGSSISLGPGSYWLALSVSPVGDLGQQVYWDSTSQSHGAIAMSTSDTSFLGGWVPALSGEYGTNLAFTLSGNQAGQTAPEPRSICVSVMFLLGLLAFRRRSAKKFSEEYSSR